MSGMMMMMMMMISDDDDDQTPGRSRVMMMMMMSCHHQPLPLLALLCIMCSRSHSCLQCLHIAAPHIPSHLWPLGTL